MEGEEVRKTLPEELVERIISMVPYPSIFKARSLSKSWLARLSSICSKEDEDKQLLATSFQKLVHERSNLWPIYCPILINDYGGVIGWHQGSNNWRSLPTLCFLPETLGPPLIADVEGALILVAGRFCLPDVGKIYVANILTRSCKRLPPLPTTSFNIGPAKLVLVDSSDTYKVILLYSSREGIDDSDINLVMSDSQSDSWTAEMNVQHCDLVRSSLVNFVQFKGSLYIVADCYPPKLWAFDLEGGAVKEIKLLIGNDFDYGEGAKSYYHWLGVCEADLVMVYYCGILIGMSGIDVLKVDLLTLTLVPVAKGSHALDILSWAEAPVTDSHNIYVGTRDVGNGPILKYEMGKDTWSSFNQTSAAYARTRFCFQPGLASFMAV